MSKSIARVEKAEHVEAFKLYLEKGGMSQSVSEKSELGMTGGTFYNVNRRFSTIRFSDRL